MLILLSPWIPAFHKSVKKEGCPGGAGGPSRAGQPPAPAPPPRASVARAGPVPAAPGCSLGPHVWPSMLLEETVKIDPEALGSRILLCFWHNAVFQNTKSGGLRKQEEHAS